MIIIIIIIICQERRAKHSIITHHQTIGRWFHHKEQNRIRESSKEKARAEKARIHAAVAVAGVATAVAAVAASANSENQTPKMTAAMASATELLASHCVEIAELTGASHMQVASAVESAVDVRTPGDLMTLTAAAATGHKFTLQFVTDLPFLLFKSLRLR